MLCTVIASFCFAVLPLTDDTSARRDLALLHGEWRIVSWETEGEKVPREKLGDNRLKFEGDEYSQSAGIETIERGKVVLKPSESPKTLDFIIKEGDDKGKTQLGIYELEGDTLKICVNKAGSTERPTSFTTKPNSQMTSVVLKRNAKRVPVAN
jgi:uncharacterized protein (TIGR03067 family)